MSEQTPSTTRIYRRDADSSTLRRPHVFSRTFCGGAELVRRVHFYETLSGERLDQDIDIPDAGLHILAVGSFLILVLNEALLGAERYRQATATRVTILAADLEKAVAMAVADGAHIAAPKFTVPHGTGYRLLHPEGLLVEYIEHRLSAFDVDKPSSMFDND